MQNSCDYSRRGVTKDTGAILCFGRGWIGVEKGRCM